MHHLHPFDIVAIATYFVVVLYIGQRAAKKSGNDEENFFLAGRKLGKLYQFFLNFGQATDANGGVSTASLVYQQGVSGVWLSFQTIFMNPYYWFMNHWFRRVRLVTTADLFEDRLGSRSLARFYALFQIIAGIAVIIGLGNLVAYKVTSSLLLKPEAQWSPEERDSVVEYRELITLERDFSAGTLAVVQRPRIDFLRERNVRGELNQSITLLDETTFYLGYTLVVGIYIVMGGMAAAALNEAFQGVLILIFSAILIPFGLSAIGGVEGLAKKVPDAAFELLGDSNSQVTGLTLVAILFVSIIQINGIVGNMGVSGSARNEFAARFGAVSGTYAKRIMIILWAFCGLIAIALYQGANSLSDPDSAWGTMSLQLLGPGLLGLMLAGVLAANMSTVATQAVSISALFVRNVYFYLRSNSTQSHLVLVGRITIGVALAAGILAALKMTNVFSILQLLLTVNVPFGAAILLIFLWRRLTAPAVWTAVLLSALVNIVAPFAAPQFAAVRSHPALIERVEDAAGRPTAVFFESVSRRDPSDPASPLEGHRRFHIELWLLDLAGLDVAALQPGTRFAARFFFDGLLPFVLLIGVSLLTRQPDRIIVDRFYGKMKTPVGTTPELEAEAIAATLHDPARFDHLKLFRNSSLELTRWDRVDTIGFFACCAISGTIIALFWLLLRAASGWST